MNAVLDTHCWPARWYAGPVRRERDGSLTPLDNSTCNYFRDRKAAEAKLSKSKKSYS